MINRQKWIAGIALLLLLLGGETSHSAKDSTVALKPAQLTVAFTESAFRGIKREDAEIAFKAFTKKIGINGGYDILVAVKTFKNVDEIKNLPVKERPELIILDSPTFLDMGKTPWIDPVFVTSQQGQVAKSYLLLTHQESKLRTLSDLRGKSLNLCATNNAKLGDYWLNSLLKENKLGSPAEFFTKVDLHNKPMPALLPVFFNKTDAALIDTLKFKLMTELNPQLNKMHIVIASEPLVESVICASDSEWSSKKFKMEVLKQMIDLHRSLSGQQILTLFKVDQIVPYESVYLNSIRTIHDRLKSPDKSRTRQQRQKTAFN